MAANRTVEFERITIRHSGKMHDRVFVVGPSGSGKTRLLHRVLIPHYSYFPVILDPKGDFPRTYWRGREIMRTPQYEAGRAQIIHVPRRQQSPAVWEEIIDRVLDRGNHTLVVDDIYGINGGSPHPKPNLLWAISGGRSIGVPVFVGCQRPSRLPVSVLSESEHYFVFPMRHEDDIKTVAANTDPRVRDWVPRLNEHDMIYVRLAPKPTKMVVLQEGTW